MHIPSIALFVALGILFSMGKSAFLIAGYNTLPKAKKAQYDTAALCRFMGKAMFSLSCGMILFALGEGFDAQWLFIAGAVVLLSTIVFILIYANTGNRFKK
ncbi:MAG: hypothetical protein BWY15_02156 [Firmicutes bacterium ADurb.Bin193]|nr:MAG: hypothetical protein BWY15_02156 [Firmicutes bacterium ADurb.Bin193]